MAAIAAALSGHQNRGGAVQPERVPDEDVGGAEEEEATAADRDTSDKKNGKIDLRNIKVNAFSGEVQSGDVDAKVREFRDELDKEIADAQVLVGHVWSDEVKKTILKTFLTGMARLWCNRLLQMADALEGGKTQRANARCALVAFVRNAYPKHTDFLETKTDLKCEDPERELQTAIAVLSRKAWSDGRLPDRTKHKATSQVTSAEAKGKAKTKARIKAKTKARTPLPRPTSQKKPETSKK
ncbi:Farnesyl diphosphate synthase [Phytophthora cinnamomi]|uniref:Farnesyl diphosphate synthase n=1 Tax=Phytophthora cinnamomi TaxID=4785 RepID=UPI003559B533|nr:Farnesyl diphosphate synthase [Phytophthora cinnamomi]